MFCLILIRRSWKHYFIGGKQIWEKQRREICQACHQKIGQVLIFVCLWAKVRQLTLDEWRQEETAKSYYFRICYWPQLEAMLQVRSMLQSPDHHGHCIVRNMAPAGTWHVNVVLWISTGGTGSQSCAFTEKSSLLCWKWIVEILGDTTCGWSTDVN